MKTMKKLASLVLALAMILGMATTAFAAGEGSITVDNPTAGATYTAYKIFDVKYNADKSAYAYTITGDSKWFTTVEAFAKGDNSGLTLTKSAADANVYIVEEGTTFSAAAFAKALDVALKADSTDKTGIALNNDGTTATVTGLDLGYYFVTTSTGALCNLTTTDPTSTIHDKNDVTFEKTVSDVSVEVGQVLDYTITGNVPDTTGYTTYKYEVSDTMSAGLTFNKDVEVKVDGKALDTADYTLTYSDDGKGFTLNIDVMKLQADVTKDIVVTYTATVNENAIAKIDNNHAVLVYSNDPTDSESTDTITVEVEVYSAKIVIDKYDTADDTKKLAGAKFVLYKDVNGAKKYYKYSQNLVSWVDAIAEATEVTTDENGAASFNGLEDGTYMLHETDAPVGYNLLASDVEVKIDGSSATDADLTSLTVTSKVANSTGTVLPETGGMGTSVIYLLGGVLVLAAVVLLVTKKRMNER